MSFDSLLTYVPPGLGKRAYWFDEDGREPTVEFVCVCVWSGADWDDDDPSVLLVDGTRNEVLRVRYDNLGLLTFETREVKS